MADELVARLYPQQADILERYRHCLQTRNRLLKDHQENPPQQEQTELILEGLNETFLKLASELSELRVRAIHTFQPFYKQAVAELMDTIGDIRVVYNISDQTIQEASEIQTILKKRMLTLRAAELASGVSLVGPHKHDIKFIYHDNDSRFFCSQGEQRALILAFKMAQIVYHHKVHGIKPILLLDDVLSELDKTKRKRLVIFLKKLKSQIILTSTELSVSHDFADENLKIFNVENGRILSAT